MSNCPVECVVLSVIDDINCPTVSQLDPETIEIAAEAMEIATPEILAEAEMEENRHLVSLAPEVNPMVGENPSSELESADTSQRQQSPETLEEGTTGTLTEPRTEVEQPPVDELYGLDVERIRLVRAQRALAEAEERAREVALRSLRENQRRNRAAPGPLTQTVGNAKGKPETSETASAVRRSEKSRDLVYVPMPTPSRWMPIETEPSTAQMWDNSPDVSSAPVLQPETETTRREEFPAALCHIYQRSAEGMKRKEYNSSRDFHPEDYEPRFILQGPPAELPGPPVRRDRQDEWRPQQREAPRIERPVRVNRGVVRTRGTICTGCVEIPRNPAIDPPPHYCFNCWQRGHDWSQCPRPRVGQYCSNCGRRGVDLLTCERCSEAYRAYTRRLEQRNRRPGPYRVAAEPSRSRSNSRRRSHSRERVRSRTRREDRSRERRPRFAGQSFRTLEVLRRLEGRPSSLQTMVLRSFLQEKDEERAAKRR